MFYISVTLEEIFYSPCLTILSRSSPRLVLFHGSAQLIAILVPTLKFSTSKLSVVQGDSVSSICLREIVFCGEKPNQDLRTNQFLEAWGNFQSTLCVRRLVGPLERPHFTFRRDMASWLVLKTVQRGMSRSSC